MGSPRPKLRQRKGRTGWVVGKVAEKRQVGIRLQKQSALMIVDAMCKTDGQRGDGREGATVRGATILH